MGQQVVRLDGHAWGHPHVWQGTTPLVWEEQNRDHWPSLHTANPAGTQQGTTLPGVQTGVT